MWRAMGLFRQNYWANNDCIAYVATEWVITHGAMQEHYALYWKGPQRYFCVAKTFDIKEAKEIVEANV